MDLLFLKLVSANGLISWLMNWKVKTALCRNNSILRSYFVIILSLNNELVL